MSKKAKRIGVVTDGFTSTAMLVQHCLGNHIRLREKSFDLDTVDANDFSNGLTSDDIYLLIRVANPEVWKQIHALVNAGQPYVYFIDDNFWLLLEDSSLDRYYQDWSVRRALETALSGASVVLCHSQRFKGFLSGYNKNIAVVPAYFDFACLDGLSEHLEEPGERRIGIVANSSRAADLAMIAPAILSIADEADDDVFFEFFGYIPPELVGHPKIRYFEPILDYRTFIRAQYMRNWMLALAPLRETRFSSFKSNNKFREFGGCGVAGIYSDIDVYRESVIEGKTGFLVGNTSDAWRAKILEALAQSSATRKMGAAAKVEVLQRYEIGEVRKSWLDAMAPALTEARTRRLPSLRKIAARVENTRVHARLMPRIHIASETGWLAGRRLGWLRRPRAAKAGFYNGQVLFKLRPGDSLRTEIRAPIDGPFHWSMVLTTYGNVPKGAVTVSFEGDGVEPHTTQFVESEICDNVPYPLKAELRADGPVVVRLSNATDCPIGIYVLSPNGSTRFESTGKTFAGRFLA